MLLVGFLSDFNSLILQYGVDLTNVNQQKDRYITYPISFTTRSIFVGNVFVSSGYYEVTIRELNLSNVYVNTTYTGNNSNQRPISWIAIGY